MDQLMIVTARNTPIAIGRVVRDLGGSR